MPNSSNDLKKREETMQDRRGPFLNLPIAACLAALAVSAGFASTASADNGKRVCVSWRHFQEERWRIDEAGVKSVLDPAGYTYVSADAQSDPQKQLTDIENLLASGCDALIVLGQDPKAVVPALDQAKAAGVPTIAYDGPIDYPDALFVSFNNVAVGHLMAEAMVKAIDHGNWVLIEGDAAHPIVQIFRSGQMEVLKPLIDKGDIKIVAQQNIPDWKPDVAQSTMEQILTQQNNNVDAVLAMNDGEAGGVAAALASQDMLGIPLSGQDGDKAALNRIAKGQQTVTIWKNSYLLGQAAAKAAIEMAEGKQPTEVDGVVTFQTESGRDQPAILLKPIAITRDNLNEVLDAKWIDKKDLCQGVTDNPPAACQ
jgi:D-xylose transport system substrate-binding protein